MVGLSPTACQRRMKRLRADKVIEADLAIVSPKAVGRELTTLVHVTLERERADIIDRFKAAIRATPEIMTGYYVTGDADFVLVVTAHDMEDFEQFTRRFFYGNPDIRACKTVPAFGKRARTWVAMAVSCTPVPVRSKIVTSCVRWRPGFCPMIT